MSPSSIPRETSQATTSAAMWFGKNEHRYGHDDRVLFRTLIGLVEKRLHLLALDEELRRRLTLQSVTKERAAEDFSLPVSCDE